MTGTADHRSPTTRTPKRRRTATPRRTAAVLAVIVFTATAIATTSGPAVAEAPDGPTAFTITSPTPPAGRAGVPYTHTFTASDTAHRWNVTSGALPAGLSLHPTTGQLTGTPTTPGTATITVGARQLRTVTAIATGSEHTCALLDDATIRCWGANLYGQLGQGTADHVGDQPGEMGDALPPVDLGTGRTATAITAGGDHTCALLDNGKVKCWGRNIYGQLGQGTTDNRGDQPGEMGNTLAPIDLGTGRTATAIAAGGYHTCALLDDGTVKCWGYGYWGQLGQGAPDNRGDQPGEMGNNLAPINLGTGRTATTITTGGSHTCAILDDSTTKCWGSGYYGQLGQGTSDHLGDQPGEMGNNLAPIDLGTGHAATAIEAGGSYTCAILDDTTTKCWGENLSGQLGQGTWDARGDQPGEMGNNLAPIALGAGRTATAIEAGGSYTCAILDDTSTKCWGDNSWGQLGLGDTAERGDQPGEMGDNLAPIDPGTGRAATTITAGGYHTCAILDDATTRCWGWNYFGQLGLGDTANRGDQPGEMGDALPAVDVGTAAAASQTFDLTIEGVTTMVPKVGLTTGGTQVTVTGVGFADVTGVRFGSTPATSFTVVDDTTITAVAPARPAGLVNVWLDSPSGSNANLAVTNFAYQTAPTTAPVVTSVSPNIGDIAGGQTITILGTGFLSATSLELGQTPATSYTIISDAKIIATTPPRATPALVNVWVTNPHGTNPNQASSWYSYRTITGPPPTVTSVSPSSGPTTGGQTITVTGAGFTGTLRVDLGSTAAPSFTVVNDTTLTVTTPARPAGLVNVYVRTNNGANPNQQTSWYRYT